MIFRESDQEPLKRVPFLGKVLTRINRSLPSRCVRGKNNTIVNAARCEAS